MKAQNRVHTETTVYPDGSVTTIVIRKNITRDSAEVIITTRNRSGIVAFFQNTNVLGMHTKQESCAEGYAAHRIKLIPIDETDMQA